MEEYEFKKGDRVVVVRLDEDDVEAGIQIGDKGEVREDNAYAPFVRMDKSNNNRSFYQHQLELEEK